MTGKRNLKSHFDTLRGLARDTGVRSINGPLATSLGLPQLKLATLTSIDDAALAEWDASWKGCQSRRYDWDWAALRAHLESDLDRFELAVWSGPALCALAIGKPSRGRQNLSIHYLEGAPDDRHPLKGGVRHCIVTAALSYATVLNCGELRLIRPLAGAIPLYAKMGFTDASSGSKFPYWRMDV